MNPTIDPSDSFGPYEVFERLGLGGMAMVHRAKKRGIEGFERSVALKRMLQHLAEDASFVESFIREAKVASLLQHPNIAQVYDFGRISGVYYIAMELVSGFDVRKLLRYSSKSGEPIPMPAVLSILGELADALEYAHAFIDDSGQHLKIVHRDISPSNLIVAHTGHLKVIDFGIAKASSRQLQTESGQIKGKLGYMSPEAALGIALDSVSDIFSMGVVAWELVTASPLFSARTDYETMRAIREAPIRPPSFHNPACPPELDAIIMSALERDAAKRLPSAGVFRAALDALATQHAIHASARQVAEWIARFAQPGDGWVRASVAQSGSARHELPLPPGLDTPGFAPGGDLPTSVQRPRTPAKLQRSPEQQKLATEIWGDDMPATASAGPDFSVQLGQPPLTSSLPPLIPQPLAIVPGHTPPHPPVAKANKRPLVILAVLAIVAGTLAALLVAKESKPEPAPTIATKAPLRFVVTPEDAVIEIGGKPVARALELEAGVYTVTVHQDGFKPWSSSLTVRAGESQTVNVTLERGLAHVSIDSDPRGLPIEVDGKAIGYQTPASFDLPAGKHELSVTSPGGEVWREELVATVDGKHAFTAMLKTRSSEQVNKPKKPQQVATVKPKPPEPEAKPPEPEPEPVKPPEKPVEPPPPPPPPKPAEPARTPVVAATAVTKLSGEIPKLHAASGESNGDALVKMCIDETGKVASVKVVKSTGAIASELSAALATWRYKPYLNKDKQPSAVCFPLSLRLVFKRAD